MYQNHFNLREEPFGVTPDRRFFCETPQHVEAAASLYCVVEQRRGFGLLVARAGLGKTSVLFTLAQMLRGKAQIAYLANPYYDRSTVLESVLASLGLESSGSSTANHRLFYQFLLKTHATGKTVVVIFDEAQDLDRDTLEAIRMLSNFETPNGKLVQIILAGQPRLAETLNRPDCEQLRQRLNVIARLAPLKSNEVHGYISRRLEIAGGSVGLFAPAVIERIATASGGVPRNINTICFSSLSVAYALGKQQVGPAELAEVLEDLDLQAGPSSDPPVASTKEPSLNFAVTRQSLRPALIAASLALIAALSIFIFLKLSP